MKSRGKTPTRFSNRVRTRRTDPKEADSKVLHGGRYSLKVKKDKPPVVEISSSHHDSYLNKEFNDEWNLVTEDTQPQQQQGNIEGRVTIMENKLEKVIKTMDALSQHFVKNNGPQMTTFQSPTNVFPALGHGGQDNHTVDRRPKDETERILQKLCEGEVATKSGFYLNCTNNVGHQEGLIGSNVPQCLKDLFKQIMPISLSKEEAEVVAYVFCKHHDGKESIVASPLGYCEGSRACLQSLRPKCEIEQDVINLSACMLTMRESVDTICNAAYWFLPTTFAQFVLAWNIPVPKMISDYKATFMGCVDLIKKVFIPVNDNNYHWYLVVIDFVNKEVVYLDSFPSDSRIVARMRSVKTMALYMEHLLQDPSLYQFQTTPKPLVSQYPIYKPTDINTQSGDGNDCGAWVIMWMVEMGLNGYRIQVDEGTRLRIALDLAMNSYNTLEDQVKNRAETWMQTLD
ncbi:Ulp1 protease family, C-terminal catalytic domain [Sesbania bispinosa]|nr:Ulp1 protease family, C-terminal catalytic domain [Sesbania bispinosa]